MLIEFFLCLFKGISSIKEFAKDILKNLAMILVFFHLFKLVLLFIFLSLLLLNLHTYFLFIYVYIPIRREIYKYIESVVWKTVCFYIIFLKFFLILKVRYTCKCYHFHDTSKTNYNVATTWNSEEEDNARYLDRHNISCTNGYSLTKFSLVQIPPWRRPYEFIRRKNLKHKKIS